MKIENVAVISLEDYAEYQRLKAERGNSDDEGSELHPFHKFISEECGVGYYDLRDFLNNLDDEQILDSIDNYVKSLILHIKKGL